MFLNFLLFSRDEPLILKANSEFLYFCQIHIKDQGDKMRKRSRCDGLAQAPACASPAPERR